MCENVVKKLDTSGLVCPIPILRLKRALASMASGERIHVIATDPGSQSDFAAFAAQTGNALIESRVDTDRFFYVLEKA